jgi:hypothetical protein
MEEVQQWQELDRQGKILAGSDEEKKYQAAVDKLQVAGDALAQKKIDMTIQEVNDLKDVKAMRTAVDAAVTMQTYNQYAEEVAKYLANKNKEISVKADPEYLTNLRAKNAQELEAIREQNREIMEGIRQSGRSESQEQRHQDRLNEIDVREQNTRTRPPKKTSKVTTPGTRSVQGILGGIITPYKKPASDSSGIAITDSTAAPVIETEQPEQNSGGGRTRRRYYTNP